MSIEMPAAEVHALAGTVRRAASNAEEIDARLDRAGNVGDILQPAVEAFLDSHRTAGRALAGSSPGWTPRSPGSPTPGRHWTGGCSPPETGRPPNERRNAGPGAPR